jgi:hypothetical protein
LFCFDLAISIKGKEIMICFVLIWQLADKDKDLTKQESKDFCFKYNTSYNLKHLIANSTLTAKSRNECGFSGMKTDS